MDNILRLINRMTIPYKLYLSVSYVQAVDNKLDWYIEDMRFFV